MEDWLGSISCQMSAKLGRRNFGRVSPLPSPRGDVSRDEKVQLLLQVRHELIINQASRAEALVTRRRCCREDSTFEREG